MKSIIRILGMLIENEGVNIRTISKQLKIDYKNTYEHIMELNKEGIISLRRFGKAISCSVRKSPHPLVYEAEYERRENLLKSNNMRVLYTKLKSLNFSFIALIFGSYAKRKVMKGSDIDLLSISEKDREREIESTLSLLPLPIHTTYLTPEEFVKMAKSKEFTVVSEAMKNNVILIGIEDYYRLMENVG